MTSPSDRRFTYDRLVLGYHGCDAEVADKVLSGEAFKESTNVYDWLGHGIYFWEYGPDRAMRFAEEQRRRGKVRTPAVVGALISLGHCFDLLDTRATSELRVAGEQLVRTYSALEMVCPKNQGGSPDLLLRNFDCAMVNFYLEAQEEAGTPYDSVRCAFQEGQPVVDGSAIFQETHIQLVVRRPGCIRGVFRPYLWRE